MCFFPFSADIETIFKLDHKVKELAEKLYKEDNLIILARGYEYATCREGALVSVVIADVSSFCVQKSLNFLRLESKNTLSISTSPFSFFPA